MLDAARHGRPAVMRAVLAGPGFAEQEHLYPHPVTGGTTEDAGRGERSGAAPVPELPPAIPVLPAIRKGGRVLDTAVTGDALHAMVQRRAAAAGIDGPVGFHSLRAGFVTQARRAGADHRAVRRQTRHSSDAMVELYDREHAPLVGNAVTRLGL